MVVEFFVPGTVKAKGRVKSRAIFKKGHKKPFVISNLPEETVNWEAIVRDFAMKAMKGNSMFTGPVRMDVTFIMPRPSGKPNEYYHITRPDKDNMEKSIADSSNNILFHDDSIICCGQVRKIYESPFHPKLGAHVRLSDAEPPKYWTDYLEAQKQAKIQEREEKKRLAQEERDRKKAEKKVRK